MIPLDIMTMAGFKGFHRDLDSGDLRADRFTDPFVYVEGRAYSMERAPLAGTCGFHFTEHPERSMVYYPPGPDTVYHHVRAMGDIVSEWDKFVTNRIEIGPPVEGCYESAQHPGQYLYFEGGRCLPLWCL